MAKKMNPFAADFEGLNKSADDKVFAMLQGAVKSSTPEPISATKVEKPAVAEVKVEPSRSERKKTAKPKPAMEWGKPIAHFNTRIPERMAELLDDLVYKLRKKGEQKTKQDLAQEALKDLLRKHSIY